jgi:hypothetical protein
MRAPSRAIRAFHGAFLPRFAYPASKICYEFPTKAQRERADHFSSPRAAFSQKAHGEMKFPLAEAFERRLRL